MTDLELRMSKTRHLANARPAREAAGVCKIPPFRRAVMAELPGTSLASVPVTGTDHQTTHLHGRKRPRMLLGALSLFSHDLAIDLGTANTCVSERLARLV